MTAARVLIATGVLAVAGTVGAMSQSQPAPSRAPVVNRGITQVSGIRVGQFTLAERPTGCTVVLVDGEGAVGAVSQRGGAPGTRETDLLDPLNLVDRVNAVVLAGGSAYGLDAAQGVMKYLEEKHVGWNVGAAGVVPIVPAAILFDLGFGGDTKIRPTADCGYKAAMAATTGAVAEGNVGAGAGATVGKMGGAKRAMKGGLGSSGIALPNGLIVGAIAAVNAAGDIIDPATGKVVAGMRTEDGKGLEDVRLLIRSGVLGRTPAGPRTGGNTTIAVVATNAKLSKAEMSRVALMADDALARSVAPSHTTSDGDTVFALATGRWSGEANTSIIGALAADMLSEAIVRAVSTAEPLGGLPSARSLGTAPPRVR